MGRRRRGVSAQYGYSAYDDEMRANRYGVDAQYGAEDLPIKIVGTEIVPSVPAEGSGPIVNAPGAPGEFIIEAKAVDPVVVETLALEPIEDTTSDAMGLDAERLAYYATQGGIGFAVAGPVGAVVGLAAGWASENQPSEASKLSIQTVADVAAIPGRLVSDLAGKLFGG